MYLSYRIVFWNNYGAVELPPYARKDPKNGFRAAKFYIRCSKALSFAKIAKLTFVQTVAIFAKVLSHTE